MEEPIEAISLTWRDEFDELLVLLRQQYTRNLMAGAASRVALAVLTILEAEQPLTLNGVVDYVQAHCVPQEGWRTRGAKSFNRDEYLRRVWPVVAALKTPAPGQALMYVL